MQHIDWVAVTTTGITVCSILHTILPPWEVFTEWPTFQKYYKLLVYIIGYAALNGRSTLWQSLSTANGSKTSKAANGVTQNGGKQNGV